MAKRRKEKDEQAEEDFKLPKFDEKEFVQKEKEKIRMTFVSFLFGLLIAVITFGFWALLQDSPFQWMLVFLFGVFNTSWLRYLFVKLNITMDPSDRKGMFSAYAIYFLTWLFLLIVLVNPPFYDAESPHIEVVSLPDMQEPGGSVKIVAHITDNAGINNNQATLIITHNQSTIMDETFTLDESILLYEYQSDNQTMGDFDFMITAEDNSGFTTQKNGSFSIDDNVIKVPKPTGVTTPPGPFVSYADDIVFDVKADVDWFYYTINDEKINVTKDEDNTGFYTTSPRIEGWQKNTLVTVNAYAKTIHYFKNLPKEFNNTIIDTSTYYFNVSDASEIGTETPPEIKLPQPQTVQVPGFEIIIFLVSLIGVVLIFKYRKKHHK